MALDDQIQDNRDRGVGNWAGSQVTWRFDLPRSFGSLTLGSEVNADIRTLQENFDVQPVRHLYLDLNDRDFRYAAFIQHEWQFRRGWTASLGLRFDDSRNYGHFLAPRIALVHQHSPKTVLKLVAGIAFRNPTAYEAFYDDYGDSQAANPALQPEKIHTLEGSVERKLGDHLNAVATVYQYWLSHFIEAVPVADGIVQYQNVSRYRALGVEFELNGRIWKGFEWAASVATSDLDRTQKGVEEWPANSPEIIGKCRLAAPLAHGRLTAAASFQYVSSRRTFGGDLVPPVYLTDITVTSSRLHPDFDVQFGIRNLFDQLAWDPASPGQGVDRLVRDGRSVYVKLIWHTRR